MTQSIKELDPSVTANNLVVEKDGMKILKSLDFSVSKGSITGLIGPSGSGKTTLIRAIVGLQKIASGELEVFGQPAGSKELRKRIGYVSQSMAIYTDLTVKQNLTYFATIVGAKKSQINKVLKQVDLFDKKDYIVEVLSGGERARTSLAIALLGNPDFLVLDEPTVGLDPLLRRDLWNLFRTMASQGRTLLISSHVMDEAERCDDVFLLRGGALLWQDSRIDLLKNTKTKTIEAAFLQLVEKRGDV